MIYLDGEAAQRLATVTVDYTLEDCMAAGPMTQADRAWWYAMVKAGYARRVHVGFDDQGRPWATYKITPFGLLALQMRALMLREAA